MFHTPAHKQTAKPAAVPAFDAKVFEVIANALADIDCTVSEAAKIVADYSAVFADCKAQRMSAEATAALIVEWFDSDVSASLQAEARAERLIGYCA